VWDTRVENAPHRIGFGIRTQHQHNTVSLQHFALAIFHLHSRPSMLVD
jgi:hypothetical protein